MKLFKSISLLALVGFLPLIMSAQNYEGRQKSIDRILENTAAFSQAFMDGDIETLSQIYAVDGKILPPGAGIVEGRPAIKERWMLPEGMTILHHKVTPEEIKIIGKFAYDIGYYEGATQFADGTDATWQGKYMIVWKKVNGDWKIYSDIWNSNDSAAEETEEIDDGN